MCVYAFKEIVEGQRKKKFLIPYIWETYPLGPKVWRWSSEQHVIYLEELENYLTGGF